MSTEERMLGRPEVRENIKIKTPVNKKLLVTGASGFLGWNLCRAARRSWETCGTVYHHSVAIEGVKILPIDLTDYRELRGVFSATGPDAVIHTAAASRPDYCEQNETESRRINIDATINIAGICSDRGIPFVFTSTDLVFDGLHGPYREQDPVSPINLYGEQKVLAEQGVLRTHPSAAVCRMPLMFGDPGPAASSFSRSMLEALTKGAELHLFVDEFRTPVSALTAAESLLLMLEKGRGLLHLGGRERVSRFNFGLMMMDVLGITEAALVRTSQADIMMPAKRPPDVSLDSSKAHALGFNPAPLREDIKKTFLKGGHHDKQENGNSN